MDVYRKKSTRGGIHKVQFACFLIVNRFLVFWFLFQHPKAGDPHWTVLAEGYSKYTKYTFLIFFYC